MEQTILEPSEAVKIIKDIMKSHTYLTEKDSRYESEIYVDYSDSLTEKQLEVISKSENKMEQFFEELEEYSMYSADYAEDEIMKEIERHWDEDEHGEFDEYAEIAREFVRENVDFNFPYDHYLKQDVKVNLMLDTGDANYDYTLNNFYSYNASQDEEISSESSIIWLVQQQGYTKEQLTEFLKNDDDHESKFLKSITQELCNVSTHMNALTFFVKMTLKDFIDLHDDPYENLVLSKGSNCGLYDPWNGAGSTLEITLDKDVVIPSKFIKAHVDGCRGYGVDSIYGMSGSFWKDTIVEKVN
jgi:hypothetical protein